jgi:7-carboxy-7-deazaguanine synthase
MNLQVAEIFKTVHGEVNTHMQGRVVTFIRLSNCNLHCRYCDTKDTQSPFYGKSMTVDEVISQVHFLGTRYICLTGGEPLLQKDAVLELLKKLNFSCHVSVETNGTVDITPFTRYVESFVVDYKAEKHLNGWTRSQETLYTLTDKDILKFVIEDEDDFNVAVTFIQHSEGHNAKKRPIFALSPCYPTMELSELARLILKENYLDVVLSVQLHKIIGVA